MVFRRCLKWRKVGLKSSDNWISNKISFFFVSISVNFSELKATFPVLHLYLESFEHFFSYLIMDGWWMSHLSQSHNFGEKIHFNFFILTFNVWAIPNAFVKTLLQQLSVFKYLQSKGLQNISTNKKSRKDCCCSSSRKSKYSGSWL